MTDKSNVFALRKERPVTDPEEAGHIVMWLESMLADVKAGKHVPGTASVSHSVIPDADPEDRRTRSVFQIDWDFSDTA